MNLLIKLIRNFFELIKNPIKFYLKLKLKLKLSKKFEFSNQIILKKDLDILHTNKNPKNVWDSMANKMIVTIKEKNINFLQDLNLNPIHGCDEQLSYKHFIELMNSNFFINNILFKIKDPIFGNPCSYKFFSDASTSTILHYFYINLIYEKFNINLFNDIDIIFEIGGGYGNLARIINSLGYFGEYKIVDLKTMGSIQKYYLKKTLITKQFNNIKFIENIESSENLKNRNLTKILIATYSVSEMQLLTREGFEKHYKEFDYLFFSYQENFYNIDNVKYFTKLITQLPEFKLVDHIADLKRVDTPVYHLLLKRI